MKGVKGFPKGYTPWNKGGTSWNKNLPCIHPRCPDCAGFLSRNKKHTCMNVDKKGKRYCLKCGKLLNNIVGKERYRKICSRCGKIIQRENEKKLRRSLIKEFGGKCVICGYKKYLGCLEFHHKIRKDKISRKDRKHHLKQILRNPGRFVLLCNRCHREIHIENNTLGFPIEKLSLT